jgi:catecholate siderophore receptor
VDGVRDDAQYYRDLYNVERVEALKGSNAMIFGRGGGGGVLNRVSKEAQWAPVRAATVEGGSFAHRRSTVDMGQALGAKVAGRVNAMYENSGGFRDAADLSRYAVNPTLAIAAGERTAVRMGYEFFNDERRVDRGIPSFDGRPSSAPITTFFGNPDLNASRMRVNAATATVEHQTVGGTVIRNRTRFADYDKYYQNSFPGAVNDAGTQVSLAAYSNGTDRWNLFTQTDVVRELSTGSVRHTLLAGAELGRQSTQNFRSTGYYNNTATSVAAPFDAPMVSTPVTFRQNATDADNRTATTVAALFAQNQIALTQHWQAVVGVRYEQFNISFTNNRNDAQLERADAMVSPRAGLVFKPAEPLSFYGGYSVSYLPSAGDQFSALTATSQTLKPEQFENYEVGAKWDARPDLSLTAAAYRLDRTNTTAPHPTEPSRVVQTGSQRARGYELGVTGNVTSAWQLAGGFASQRAEITSTTTAARAGARVALVPEQTVSLWNRYQVARAVGLGLGVVHQAEMFASIDNAVTLPSFTRLDGGLFVTLTRHARAQLNVENLLDRRYYPTAHSNNNISPGAPRTVRLSLTATP